MANVRTVFIIAAVELSAHKIVCKPSHIPVIRMDKHSGISAWFGAVLAIYSAITQPQVVAQIPGAVGHALGAVAVSPIASAIIGTVGAIVAAKSMPRGTPKSE